MPFQADTRCGLMKVELNVTIICKELEIMLEKYYTEHLRKGSKFWYYVLQLENNYSVVADKGIEFWEWFNENYNNIYEWNDIEEYFVEEEEEVECHDCGEISKCFEKRQGVSMGRVVYDYSIGDCCRLNYTSAVEAE